MKPGDWIPLPVEAEDTVRRVELWFLEDLVTYHAHVGERRAGEYRQEAGILG